MVTATSVMLRVVLLAGFAKPRRWFPRQLKKVWTFPLVNELHGTTVCRNFFPVTLFDSCEFMLGSTLRLMIISNLQALSKSWSVLWLPGPVEHR